MGAQAEELSVLEARAEQNSGESQYFCFAVPARRRGAGIVIHLGFRRSTDLDAADKPGQDYAVARGGDGYVVGVVADGVSQSFYGDLAARSVGERLLRYLWENRESPPGESAMGEALVSFMGELKEEVEQFPLSETLPSIQRQALETTRRVDGSQAVFSAFILDGVGRSLHLYQVGDVVAFARDAETAGGDAEIIKADAKGRWSSTGRTKMKLQAVRRDGVEAIIIKSDGTKEWGATLGRDEVNEQSFKSVADGLADYDDVSFVAAFVEAEPGEAHGPSAGRPGASPPPDGEGGRPVADDPAPLAEFNHTEDAEVEGELAEGQGAAVSIDGAEGAEGDAMADDRRRDADDDEHRNRVIRYLAVFTAGILVGVFLTVFISFFLAYAGLARRAPAPRAAGHEENEARSGQWREGRRCGAVAVNRGTPGAGDWRPSRHTPDGGRVPRQEGKKGARAGDASGGTLTTG